MSIFNYPFSILLMDGQSVAFSLVVFIIFLALVFDFGADRSDQDEHGGDEKLICVPVDSTFPYYSDIGEQKDLPSIVLAQIEHFFTHYKDLEPEKWVRIGKWGDADDARRVVLECIERYQAGT